MRNLLFAAAFVLLVHNISAQAKNYDLRLLSKFSEKELKEMQYQNPETLSYWNFYVANAFQVVDLPNEKSNAHEIKGNVQIQNINLINIFDLHYLPLAKDYQYYRIEGTNKLLVILSEEQIKEKFEKTSK